MQDEQLVQSDAEKNENIFIKILNKIKEFFGNIFHREPKEELEEIPELYLPETTEDLVWLLRKLPEEVLSSHEKKMIAGSMTFKDKWVRDIMTPKDKAVFVHENDFMGPLTLDRLYKSGLKHFPVLDTKGGVAGVLHTESLNSLEVRETDRASSYIDPTVYYMREDYNLEQAMAAFLRTGSHFFVVINTQTQMTGIITFGAMLRALLDKEPTDDFDADTDISAVARRHNLRETFINPSGPRPVQSVGFKNNETNEETVDEAEDDL